MGAKAAWMWAAVAAAMVLIVGVVVVELWVSFGPTEITPAGWVALVLGVVLTFGLGVGLMSLIFISDRQGYDENRDRRDG